MSRGIEAKIIADSVSPDGVRLTTMQLRYHRFIHSEFMTHRVFSRNASSSRAIPVGKMIKEVRTNPAVPIYWGINERGMQARFEAIGELRENAKWAWLRAREEAVFYAEALAELGMHKQIVNRILEPFMWIDVVVTATEWDNFFALRRHADAQPEIKALADAMWIAMNESIPQELQYGEWHLPYVNLYEPASWLFQTGQLNSKKPQELGCLMSAARCARVSYKNHDGTECDVEKDLVLASRLLESKHMSPFEHQATPLNWDDMGIEYPEQNWSGNFRGWVQYRKTIKGG